jgi:hypothetical protein
VCECMRRYGRVNIPSKPTYWVRSPTRRHAKTNIRQGVGIIDAESGNRMGASDVYLGMARCIGKLR